MQAKDGSLTPLELRQALQSRPGLVLIDLRSAAERAEGPPTPPNGRQLAAGAIGTWMAELPKEKPIVLVCKDGKASAMAAQTLHQAGYRARFLAGGALAWKQALGEAPGAGTPKRPAGPRAT